MHFALLRLEQDILIRGLDLGIRAVVIGFGKLLHVIRISYDAGMKPGILLNTPEAGCAYRAGYCFSLQRVDDLVDITGSAILFNGILGGVDISVGKQYVDLNRYTVSLNGLLEAENKHFR